MKPLFLISTTLVLTSCSTSLKFVEKDLAPTMYKGYWAMTPVEDIHRVIKFYPTGMVKIYDYECMQDSYRLNTTETVYLHKEKPNTFTLLDEKKKPFAHFIISQANAHQFKAKEQFIDRKIDPHIWHLSYTNSIGAKPICSPNFY
ncbi:hypothetical protein A6B43_08025 [Vespertiliibacter pulmonis]|uniref:Lipoprotein n=1 Tax=Vespertiliibacter pulmonis TaxID=1443036 RepID=A0A3N4VS96_9PAST|nr:hypothetical protein [Vespertiliibacter pulmonis]QLB21472.1 hypothetical protein A6B43_08025 [Vespertiliibacter pulmonis]RPE85888.1 hypothetical protein EDC46_0273 [Vespertiliibacter pulmonis]